MATSLFQSLKEKFGRLLGTVRSPPSPWLAASPSSSSCSQIAEDLEKLRRVMERIRALLSDAEQREIRESRIKLWLDELRDVGYDAEDLIEDVEYESLWHQRLSEEGEHPPAAPGQKGISIWGDGEFQGQIAAKIKAINNRYNHVWEDRVRLELREEDGKSRASLPEPRVDRETGCLIDETRVHGRRGDRRNVIDMLLSDGGGYQDRSVRVVSLVGMGGVGKTTLAQLVFNDRRVAAHFRARLWVCVSDSFDAMKLTRDILRQLLGRSCELQELSSLQQLLRKELAGKMFLLVLDDAWSDRLEHWDALWVSLLDGAKGSRVLLTTRNERVSRASGAMDMYPLGCLSDDDCWSLFAQRVFYGSSMDEYQHLVPTGREIVRRCRGLPLTVKMLAGLLFGEFRVDRWEDILRSDLWELPEGKDYILPALKLSYYHLPSHVKPCFAYCAVFPKGYKLEKNVLVYLWMAQGYLGSTLRKPMEDVGREYFEELLQRSFFQQGGDGCFLMHDLIHDLALSIRGGECSRLEEDGTLSNRFTRARHLWFEDRATDRAVLLSCGLIKARHLWFEDRAADKAALSSCALADNFHLYLRTCYLIRDSWVISRIDCDSSLRYGIDDAFQNMKYLRVLYLYGWKTDDLPDSLGNLKHLRYLSIRRMVKLARLPETLGNLLSLQTLEIIDCFDLEELPNSLKDLFNLRHLVLGMPRYSYSLQLMPRGIGRLTQLQVLSTFVVGEGSGAAGIEELTMLQDLRGKLVIRVRSLSNWVTCGGGAGSGNQGNEAILKNKLGLESLILEFNVDWATSGDQSLSASMQQTEEFVEALQPNINIKELVVDGYTGSRFPKWMADSSYSRLQSIRLDSCRNCRHLPPLGQLPSLKHLEVRFIDELRIVDRDFLGEGSAVDGSPLFPALERLLFYCLPECDGMVVGMEEGGAFPCLDSLHIEDCQKLKYVQLRHLTSLRELHIARCHNLTVLDFAGHVHIRRIHTMWLLNCRRLNFPRARRLLPPSLRRFEVTGSPLLEEWARRHLDN